MIGFDKLTLDEKIALVTGKGMWHTNDLSGKLPMICVSDGPHGIRKTEETESRNNFSHEATCFPTASAAACSWDTELIAAEARAIAAEAINLDVDIVLGPGTNMKRSPLCGRNFEYYSEDPYLAGSLAAAYINAMQSEGVGTSLKHFAGNSQETHRMRANSQIDERALHEIYLRAFEIAVRDAQPATIMNSYNRLNGTYSAENRELLTEILRDKWGFKGLVVSDWSACTNLSKSLKAGMDLEMPDSAGIHAKKLKADLAKGTITEDDINIAAKRVYDLIEKYSELRASKAHKELGNKNHELAREISEKSAVLLKNDNALPITGSEEIVIIGDLAEKIRFQGGGSSHINTSKTITALKAFDDNGVKYSFTRGYDCSCSEVDEAMEAEALALAKEGKPVFFFGGLTDITEGEGYDRKTLSLPENQLSLMEKLIQVNGNISFIAFGGAPFCVPFFDKLKAMLMMYLGGEAVAEACVNLIIGKATPCGKLAETFPIALEDTPCFGNYATGSDDVEYRESLFMGYRYYDSYGKKVRFPFGYGLSYTSFEYSGLKVSSEGRTSVSFTVKNIGSRAGEEISQVYVINPEGNFIRAKRELRGFAKTKLESGEEKQVTIELDCRSFMVYDADIKDYVTVPGNYRIVIGRYCGDEALYEDITVSGKPYEKDDRSRLPAYFDETGLNIPREQFGILYAKPLSHFDKLKKGEYTLCNSLKQLADACVLGRIVHRFAIKAVYGMFPGVPKDDPELMMFLEMVNDGTFDAVIVQSRGAMPVNIGDAIVLAANGKTLKSIAKLLAFK